MQNGYRSPSTLYKRTVPLTIPAGASASAALDLGADTLIGLVAPAAWTAAALTFEAGFDDDATFVPLYKSNGAIYALSVTAGTLIQPATPLDFLPLHRLRLRSGTASAPVVQAADRTFLLILKDCA